LIAKQIKFGLRSRGKCYSWTNGAARPAATSPARTNRMRIKSFIAVVSLIIGFAVNPIGSIFPYLFPKQCIVYCRYE
jgi:hypothetical protein